MAQAYVSEIQVKQTSAGNMYDFVLSDGNKLGAGKYPPKNIAAGDYISYEVEMRGQYKNFKAGSVAKLVPPAGVTAPTSATPAASPARSGGANSFDDRQTVISKQAALNSAMQMVTLLVNADALPVPKTAKSDKKADLMVALVDQFTGRFYKQATGEDFPFPDGETLAAVGIEGAEGDANWDEA